MIRSRLRALTLGLLLGALALPAAATVVWKGTDYWRTPPNGSNFTFPAGDVESLCNVAADPNWDHQVHLQGVPAKGSDWDTAIARLHSAKFNKSGNAHTLVKFKSLALASSSPAQTPCGKLNWTVRLARHLQPITKMRLTLTSKHGGKFFADLAVKVEMRATRADTGAHVGSLFYSMKLGDPPGGTGTDWSFGKKKRFRAGMSETGSCLAVLREKLGTFPTSSQHYYYISDMIARGDCKERPN